MKLAFYKAAMGKPWDKVVAWKTHSPYSHVEMCFPEIPAGADPPISKYVEGDGKANGTLCYSSSPRDGGVRFKYINLQSGKWDLVNVALLPTPDALATVTSYCQTLVGLQYDWLGIIGFALPFGEHDDKDRFCSELAVDVMQHPAMFSRLWPRVSVNIRDAVRWKTSPGALYKLVRR